MSGDPQHEIDALWEQIATIKNTVVNLVIPGTVISFDAAKNTAKLDIGVDGGTHDIPNGGNHANSAGGHWAGVKAGQQVTVFAPGGDLAHAFFMPGGYLDTHKKPSTRADEDVFDRGDSHVRIREGGYVQLHALTLDKLKIKIGPLTFQLSPSALVPSPPLED